MKFYFYGVKKYKKTRRLVMSYIIFNYIWDAV